MTELGERIKSVTSFVSKWIAKNKGLIIGIALAFAALTGLGISLVALGLAIKLVGIGLTVLAVAIGVVKALVLFLLSPIGLLVAAFALAGVALFTFSETFRKAIMGIVSFFGEQFKLLSDILMRTFKGIITALSLGDFNAAWEIMVSGLQVVWLQMVDIILDAWDKFATFFIEAWIGAVSTVQEVWFKVQKAIVKGIFELAKAGGVLSDVFSIILGVDVKTLDLSGIQNQVEQDFNRKIQQTRTKAAAQFEQRRVDVDKANKEREAAIARTREQFNQRITDINKRAEAAGVEAIEAPKPKVDIPGPAVVVAPAPLRALERGSVEAIQQFQKNLKQQPMEKLLANGEDQLEIQKKIEQAILANPAVIMEA